MSSAVNERPAAQKEHEVEPVWCWYFPCWQFSQEANVFAPDVELEVPLGQAKQEDESEPPRSVPYLPPPQRMQLVRPFSSMYLPFGQDSHASIPAELPYIPMLQSSHVPLPLEDAFPGLQFVPGRRKKWKKKKPKKKSCQFFFQNFI